MAEFHEMPVDARLFVLLLVRKRMTAGHLQVKLSEGFADMMLQPALLQLYDF